VSKKGPLEFFNPVVVPPLKRSRRHVWFVFYDVERRVWGFLKHPERLSRYCMDLSVEVTWCRQKVGSMSSASNSARHCRLAFTDQLPLAAGQPLPGPSTCPPSRILSPSPATSAAYACYLATVCNVSVYNVGTDVGETVGLG
jgi:hypothetical protein